MVCPFNRFVRCRVDCALSGIRDGETECKIADFFAVIAACAEADGLAFNIATNPNAPVYVTTYGDLPISVVGGIDTYEQDD